MQDAGETGINGVTVQLLDSSNNVVGTTTTSGDGNYTFNNLAAGTYTVKVSGLPAGTAETYDLDGIATANQATFTLAAGQNRTDVDFGYRYNGSVGDRVWLDTQRQRRPGRGRGRHQRRHRAAARRLRTTSSAPPPRRRRQLHVQQPGAGHLHGQASRRCRPASARPTTSTAWPRPTRRPSLSPPAQNRTDVDFGYRYNGSVGDRVWLDSNGNGVQDAGEAGINGVTVQLLDASNNVVGTATTSGDGNYTFNNLAPGTYTVRVSGRRRPG